MARLGPAVSEVVAGEFGEEGGFFAAVCVFKDDRCSARSRRAFSVIQMFGQASADKNCPDASTLPGPIRHASVEI